MHPKKLTSRCSLAIYSALYASKCLSRYDRHTDKSAFGAHQCRIFVSFSVSSFVLQWSSPITLSRRVCQARSLIHNRDPRNPGRRIATPPARFCRRVGFAPSGGTPRQLGESKTRSSSPPYCAFGLN